jgi:hypothetical protein
MKFQILKISSSEISVDKYINAIFIKFLKLFFHFPAATSTYYSRSILKISVIVEHNLIYLCYHF